MFEKKERTCLTVYLHYNRDAKKLHQHGDLVYHSKRMRYVLLYVDQNQAEALIKNLKKERFVKKILPSFVKDIDQNFVGNLYRDEKENVII
ncbi:YlbG family protein [Streptococcus cameli]